MANFKVADGPVFRVSEVDLRWVLGFAHGGRMLLEDGDFLLLEDGGYFLYDDYTAKSYIFKVSSQPTFRVSEDGR